MSERAPFRRQHTGTFAGDQIQQQAQDASRRINAHATDLEDHEARLATVERAIGTGVTRIAMSDANMTLTEAQGACMQQVFTGTLTAGRTVTVSNATDATAFVRWMTNLTTGGFSLTISNSNGTATLTNGSTKAVMVSASGPALLN